MFQKLQSLRQGSRTVDEYATEFFKMINCVEVRDSEQQLVMRFIGGLRQQIQLTLNLFQPQSFSEAHQQAITVENQSRMGSHPWGSTRQSPRLTPPPTSRRHQLSQQMQHNRRDREGSGVSRVVNLAIASQHVQHVHVEDCS